MNSNTSEKEKNKRRKKTSADQEKQGRINDKSNKAERKASANRVKMQTRRKASVNELDELIASIDEEGRDQEQISAKAAKTGQKINRIRESKKNNKKAKTSVNKKTGERNSIEKKKAAKAVKRTEGRSASSGTEDGKSRKRFSGKKGKRGEAGKPIVRSRLAPKDEKEIRRAEEERSADRRRRDRERAERRKNKADVNTRHVLILVIIAVFVMNAAMLVMLAVKGVHSIGTESVATETESVSSVVGTSEETAVAEVPEETVSTVTILGTGDNLIQEALYTQAQTDDGYDFTTFYQHVKSYIQAADIATVNQETPLATDIADPSGDDSYNTPTEAGDALIDAGFDVINQANDHTLDMGEEGAAATMDYWDSQNIPYVGLYRSDEDMENIRIIEKNGIKVAFLGFTSESGQTLDEESEIKLCSMDDEAQVESLIEKAKSEADYVVVHAHWGNEGDEECNTSQESMAQNMVDWGADLIFGHHPQVMQRLDVLKRSSDGKECPVWYSGGDFLSGQENRNQLISGLLTVTVTKDNTTGEVTAETMNFLPIVTHYVGDRQDLVIYPLSQYTEALAGEHGVADYEGIAMSLDYINEIINANIPSLYINKDGLVNAYTEPKGSTAGESASSSANNSTNSSTNNSSSGSSSYDEDYDSDYDYDYDEDYDSDYDYDEDYDYDYDYDYDSDYDYDYDYDEDYY